MDTSGRRALSPFLTYAVIGVLVAAVALYIGSIWWMNCNTMPTAREPFQTASAAAGAGGGLLSNLQEIVLTAGPKLQGMQASGAATTAAPAKAEGFYAGPARGAGAPDCLRSSADAAAVYDAFASKVPTAEEGPDDLRELGLLLSKISCFKRDLTGTAGVVEATRYQPFSTSHDLEPVAETTARCFAKTIPQRDLSLSLDKWGSRGTYLIKRLCTSFNLTATEEEEVLAAFGRALADLPALALGRCCDGGTPVIAGVNQPRMVGGYEPPGDYEMREYKGYY